MGDTDTTLIRSAENSISQAAVEPGGGRRPLRRGSLLRREIGDDFFDAADPLQFRNLFDGRNAPAPMNALRARLKDLLAEAHDEFLPGTRYGEWFTLDRDLIRNALGPISR
jgi:hypothetical protein